MELKGKILFSFKVLTVFITFFTAIDLFTKYSDVIFYLGVSCSVVFALSLASLFIPKMNSAMKRYFHDLWHTTILFTLTVIILFSFSVYHLNRGSETGSIIGDNIGIINAMREHLSITNRKLDEISSNMEDVSRVVSGAREMENPRMELSRLGVSWSEGDFLHSLRSGDLVSIELFLRAGMLFDCRESIDYFIPICLSIVDDKIKNLPQVIALLKNNGVNLDQKYLFSSKGFTISKSNELQERVATFGPLVLNGVAQLAHIHQAVSQEVRGEHSLWQVAILTRNPKALQAFIDNGVSSESVRAYIKELLLKLKTYSGSSPFDAEINASIPCMKFANTDEMEECIEYTLQSSSTWKKFISSNLEEILLNIH